MSGKSGRAKGKACERLRRVADDSGPLTPFERELTEPPDAACPLCGGLETAHLQDCPKHDAATCASCRIEAAGAG